YHSSAWGTTSLSRNWRNDVRKRSWSSSKISLRTAVSSRSVTASVGGEDAPGVQDARWVEGGLDPSLQGQLGRVLQRLVVAPLGPPDAVLARHRAAHVVAHGEDGTKQPGAPGLVVLVDREVDVAVAGVAAPVDGGAMGPSQELHVA